MNLDELRGRLFVDVPTAAREVFGVDERTVRRAIADGQLPGVKVGNKTLLPVPRLLAMLGACHQTKDHELLDEPAESRDQGFTAAQGGLEGRAPLIPLRGGGDAA